ncbi:MAG: HEAT repeat domain-containing protein [Planctomycetes bacterium]|nr:HEAT repeat domain-containing protein [Planctomycetota bacterium]
MKRAIRTSFLTVLAIALFLASGLWASDDPGRRGPRGQYRGPTDEVLASTGVQPGVPGIGPLADSTVAAEGFNRWEFWFEIHKDILLRSPDRHRRTAITDRPPGAPPALGFHIDSRAVRQDVLPALLKAAESANPGVRASALMALGKTGLHEVVPVLRKALEQGSDFDRRFALLGLGSIDVRSVLLDLLTVFQDEGRDPELRAYAALAMGMQGKAEVLRMLADYVERALDLESIQGRSERVAIAAVTALGMGEASTTRFSVPVLVSGYERLVRREALSRSLRCAILSSLGKLRDVAALPTLIGALSDSDVEIRRAAALACGELGSPEAVDPLCQIIDDGGDQQSKGFAAMSLGRIGSQEALEALRGYVRTRKSRTVQSFSALSLGLAGDRDSAPILRELVSRPSEEDLRGAFAIALGFLHDEDAVPALHAILENRGADPDLRGYVAVAIGMIRPKDGLDHVLHAYRADRNHVEELERCFLLAMGLSGSPRATPYVIRALRTETRDSVRGAAVTALNLLRDRAAIQPLISMALPSSLRVSTELREFAVMGLGALSERTNFPLYAEAFYATNYRLHQPLLQELMEIL